MGEERRVTRDGGDQRGQNGAWAGLWGVWINGDGAKAAFKEVVRVIRALGAAAREA